MKKVLIVAATHKELQAADGLCMEGCSLSFLVTGIGAPATAYALGTSLATQSFNAVIQVGVAGSFTPAHPVGSVVLVARDCFADFGIDNRGNFVGAPEMGFLSEESVYTGDGFLENPCVSGLPEWAPLLGLPAVTGITVQTVSGSRDLISLRRSLFRPDVESMEGAALFYACLKQKVPFMALRAISNPVEPRNPKHWQISVALEALSQTLRRLSDGCCGESFLSDHRK